MLGLQGCYTLNRYGSEQALEVAGRVIAGRELGPVITALLYAAVPAHRLTASV